MDRYKQILLTYLRRPFSSWQTGLWVVLAVFLTAYGLSGRGVSAASLTLGMTFLSSTIWGHFREQITDARKRLMPMFLHPQIVVFLACSVFCIGAFSLLSLHCTRVAESEMAGLLLLIFGYIGCCVVTRSQRLIFLGFVGLFFLLVSITGEPPPIGVNLSLHSHGPCVY
ncbi:MAG: hypothetical protein ACP5I8_15470 [Phycisphaerae bacterium]